MAAVPNPANNRTDLPRTTAPGQPYGVAGAQQAAMAAVPMGAPPTSQAPAPPPPTPLGAPTERPNEPITAGMPFGAGPGPEMLRPYPGAPPQPGSSQDLLERWQGILQAVPAARNANLIAILNAVGGQAGRGTQAPPPAPPTSQSMPSPPNQSPRR
jgi:hypothetical protein